jgi:hypothetical protein
MEVVVYEGGYVAVYNESRPTSFVRFIEEELLEFASVRGDDGADQATLHEAAGGPECDRCGRESDTVDDSGYCVTCRDKLEAEGEDPYASLDTVTVADGGGEDAE